MVVLIRPDVAAEHGDQDRDVICGEERLVQGAVDTAMRVLMTVVGICLILAMLGASATAASAQGWSFRMIPSPPGATDSRLASVSCTSSTSCTAVGGYSTLTAGIERVERVLPWVERWDGNRWFRQSVPLPRGQAISPLVSVSCASNTICTAVGGEVGTPFAEHWGGGRWSLRTFSVPTGSLRISISGISCTSRSACTAVGDEALPFTGGELESEPLAERWDGSHWLTQVVPLPGEASFIVGLSAVSCTSATSCTAVGHYNPNWDSGRILPFAEHWDGRRWSVQTMPVRVRTEPEFAGISCTSNTMCIAVGRDEHGALAERWDGRRWSIQTMALAFEPATVSCASRTACTAVGGTTSSQQSVGRWDGRRWSFQTVPNQLRGGFLLGVSCPSTTSCTAVGNDVSGRVVVGQWGAHPALPPQFTG